MLAFELIVQGLIQGSIYALIAVGLTLVYGLLRILHVAHAGLFTLGGYFGVLVTNATGSLGLALVVAMVAVGVLGMLIYRFCYEPILARPPHVALIASRAGRSARRSSPAVAPRWPREAGRGAARACPRPGR